MPRTRSTRPGTGRPHPGRPPASTRAGHGLLALQRTGGNRAVGRMLGGGGAPGGLPDPIRGQLEDAFDTDLSAIRLRVSPEARRYDARAFTRGSEITFAPGKLDPGTRAGRALLTHEVSHALQQSAGRVQADGEYGGAAISRSRRLEQQAHRTGQRVAAGGRAEASLRGIRPRPGRGGVMQRDIDPERQAKIDTLEKKVFFNGLHDYALPGTCDTYKIGLWVYVDHTRFEDMYRTRTPLVAERKAREKEYVKTLAKEKGLSRLDRQERLRRWQTDAKDAERRKAAELTLGPDATEEEVEKLLKAGTGHTWLEFRRQEGDRVLGRYTYGFSSIAGGVTAKEATAGKSQGVVKNPDNYAKPEKGTVRWHALTAKKYKDALKKALAIKESPPRYSLTGDNCTSFAKDVLAGASVAFPSGGYPVGPLGIGGTIYSPNLLYKGMTDEA